MSDFSDKMIPRHVAIIMDGNGRWAKKHGKPRWKGHQAGAEALGKVVRAAATAGVEVLSVFAFSSENWRRPKEEIQHLMKLFARALKTQVKELHKNNILLKLVGQLNQFPKNLQTLIKKAEKLTAKNTGLKLVIAANYGGQWDIVQATQQLVSKIMQKEVAVDQIDENLFAQYLSMADLSDPDLFIRTSGEKRISNFFLWQLAYTELYFTETLWPDFDEKAFQEALVDYQKRRRRFGALDSSAK